MIGTEGRLVLLARVLDLSTVLCSGQAPALPPDHPLHRHGQQVPVRQVQVRLGPSHHPPGAYHSLAEQAPEERRGSSHSESGYGLILT